MKQIPFLGVLLVLYASGLQAAQVKTQARASRSASDGAMQSSMKNEETLFIQEKQRVRSASDVDEIPELMVKFIGEFRRITLAVQKQSQEKEEAQKRSSMIMAVSRILNDKTKNKEQADSNAKKLADYEKQLGFKIVDWNSPEEEA